MGLSRLNQKIFHLYSGRSSTPSREPISTRRPVSSYSCLMAFTSDSPRFTLPPGRVQSLNPIAWRTNSTLCSSSSIQAMTDTSLVGRVLAIFGRSLGIQLYGHLELLAGPTQNIDQKITQ